MVKCVAAVFSDYCAGIPVEVVSEEVSDAFGLVHFFDLVFCFRLCRGGFDLWTSYILLISRQQLFSRK